VEEYYRLSPVIVKALSKRSDAADVYTRLFYDFILPAYSLIRLGKMDAAYRTYRKMIKLAARCARVSDALENSALRARVYDDKLWSC
jgi:hypothetical protein